MTSTSPRLSKCAVAERKLPNISSCLSRCWRKQASKLAISLFHIDISLRSINDSENLRQSNDKILPVSLSKNVYLKYGCVRGELTETRLEDSAIVVREKTTRAEKKKKKTT